MKFEIFKSEKDKKYYFRLKAANGEIILSSQAYSSKTACNNGIKSVRNNGNSSSSFESKITTNGKSHFVLLAGNGQVIGTSQLYTSEKNCKEGIESVIKASSKAKINDLTIR